MKIEDLLIISQWFDPIYVYIISQLLSEAMSDGEKTFPLGNCFFQPNYSLTSSANFIIELLMEMWLAFT